MIRPGDIILIPFPFSELTDVKVRPAMVICSTKDKYKDLVLAAISSQNEASTDLKLFKHKFIALVN